MKYSLLARSPTIHRGLECASVFEFSICLIVCLLVGKYYHFSPHPPLSPLSLISKKFAVINAKQAGPGLLRPALSLAYDIHY